MMRPLVLTHLFVVVILALSTFRNEVEARPQKIPRNRNERRGSIAHGNGNSRDRAFSVIGSKDYDDGVSSDSDYDYDSDEKVYIKESYRSRRYVDSDDYTVDIESAEAGVNKEDKVDTSFSLDNMDASKAFKTSSGVKSSLDIEDKGSSMAERRSGQTTGLKAANDISSTVTVNPKNNDDMQEGRVGAKLNMAINSASSMTSSVKYGQAEESYKETTTFGSSEPQLQASDPEMIALGH